MSAPSGAPPNGFSRAELMLMRAQYLLMRRLERIEAGLQTIAQIAGKPLRHHDVEFDRYWALSKADLRDATHIPRKVDPSR